MKEFQHKNKFKLRMRCNVYIPTQKKAREKKNTLHETSNSKIIFILTYMTETVMNTNATRLSTPSNKK